MYKYCAYVNEYEVFESDNFKQLFKRVVENGIYFVRNYGFSRVLRIYNAETGDSICTVFFNQRKALYGTEFSEVRVHRYRVHVGEWTKPVRKFIINN